MEDKGDACWIKRWSAMKFEEQVSGLKWPAHFWVRENSGILSLLWSCVLVIVNNGIADS